VSRPPVRLRFLVIPVLAVLAIGGYLAGNRHPASKKVAASEQMRIASVSRILFEYPSSWQPVRAQHPIPSLQIAQQLLLAPAGHLREAGLIGGTLPAGEASPLPARFLADLQVQPHAEIVGFPAGQAYRYSLAVNVPNYQGTLELFAIPSQGTEPSALACYATEGYTYYLKQCEQIVAGLSLAGGSQYTLTPDAAYAHSLAAVIDGLNGERLALRRAVAHARTSSTVGTLAATLSARFASAARALETIEAPLAAVAAQSALVTSLLHTRDAYVRLSALADKGGSSGSSYTSALPWVDAAEAAVDSALSSFELLGYKAP
jgi:hypothetical protein